MEPWIPSLALHFFGAECYPLVICGFFLSLIRFLIPSSAKPISATIFYALYFREVLGTEFTWEFILKQPKKENLVLNHNPTFAGLFKTKEYNLPQFLFFLIPVSVAALSSGWVCLLASECSHSSFSHVPTLESQSHMGPM